MNSVPQQPTHDLQGRLDNMSLAEQVSLLSGVSLWLTQAVASGGVSTMKFTDGPNGARGEGLHTGVAAAAFPAGIGLAATWNTELIAEVGSALAVEARRKGAHVLLAPTINLHRSVLNGRNFECFSEDPCLTGEVGLAYVRGVQRQGVAATAKHFVGNESEFERHTISSEIDERTLREVYLRPFERVVKDAGVWAIMAAYNRVNGTGACESPFLLDQVLRKQWGWDGLVMSDWWATSSTAEALRAGLDLEMPGPTRWRGAALMQAVQSGELPLALVRRSAERLLRLADRVGAHTGSVVASEQAVDCPADRALIRRAGAQGMVLLQNKGVLPLAKTGQTLAIFGPNAQKARIMGGGSAMLHAHRAVSPMEGLQAAFLEGTEGTDGQARILGFLPGATNHRYEPKLDASVSLTFFNNADLSGEPVYATEASSTEVFWVGEVGPGVDLAQFTMRACFRFVPEQSGLYRLGVCAVGGVRVLLDGEMVTEAWDDGPSGLSFMSYGGAECLVERELRAGHAYEFAMEYASPVGRDVPFRAVRLGLSIPMGEADLQAAALLAAQADVALVFAGNNGEWDSEGMDRPGLQLPGQQDALIGRVAAANHRTVVVLQTGGPVAMPWANEVKAIIQAWYPGQECGHSIADVLLGLAEPGGRLPQTFPIQLADDATQVSADTYPGQEGRVCYSEGLFFGYRHHDRSGVAPLFPFGHGLSYSTLVLESVRVNEHADGVEVLVDVYNAGQRMGSEVVQLYVRDPVCSQERPFKELKAFAKVHLAPGERGVASLCLGVRDFAFFNSELQAWVAEAGDYELLIGCSSADIRHTVGLHRATLWTESL